MRFAAVRRFLFQVHMWSGLVLGIVLVLLGLSGSLLVYDEDIVRIVQPVPHVTSTGAPASLDRLVAAAREATGRARGQAQIILPDAVGEAATVRIGQFMRPQPGGPQGQAGGAAPGARGQGRSGPPGERMGARPDAGPNPAPVDVFVDPVSATVLGQRPAAPIALFAWAHQLHGNFLMGREGRTFVGWMGVAMLALGVSGLVLWWPKRGQWKYGFMVRRKAKGLRFHRELHGMVGIWTFIVFMVVSFSGVAIVFPQTINAMTGGGPLPVRTRGVPEVEPLRGATRIGADAAAKLALDMVSDSRLRSVTLPARPNQAVSVSLRKFGDMNAGVTIDPWRASVIQVRDPSATFMGWQRPLHDGTVGGIWRFLVFVSGLLPALFVFTGVVMWVKKRKARIRMDVPLAEAASP